MFLQTPDQTTLAPRLALGDVQGNGGRGGNRRSARKPDEGNAGRGGNRWSRRETAVDESRNTVGKRVARHQADYK